METIAKHPDLRVIDCDGAEVRALPVGADQEARRPSPRLRVIRTTDDLDRQDNWTDLTGPREDIEAAVAEATAAGPGVAIEYEGFSVVDPGEPDDVDYLSSLARGVARHGEAFEHWSQLAADTSQLEQFADRYLGCCPSPDRLPEHLADSLGVSAGLAALRPDVRPFIGLHLSAWADHLQELGVIVSCEGSEGLHLFLPPEAL